MAFSASELTFNRAGKGAEHLQQVAQLIYGTDEHIYPAWRDTDKEFADLIVPWMCAKALFSFIAIFTLQEGMAILILWVSWYHWTQEPM